MGLISLLWGIVAMIWMIVALIPLPGWGNWFLIPFAAVGAIIAAIGVLFTAPGSRGRAKTGLALNGLVLVVAVGRLRSEEPTSELQSQMRISYAVFCLKKKTTKYK